MWIPQIRVHPHAPVVALDIDGTLAAYHEHFRWFAQLYLCRPVDITYTNEMQGEFSEALGLEKAVYRDIKLAYRQGGLKRSLPIFEGVAKMVADIRREGYQVWICTTRPWLRLDNIDKDTAFWLAVNDVQYDGVLFGEEKYQDLVDIVGINRVVCVVDDLPAQVVQAQILGVPAVMRTGLHNEYIPFERSRVADTPTMQDFIFNQIHNFETK